MSGFDDKTLIQKIKKGDKQALKELMGIYYARLVCFANKLVNHREDAEEIVQDVFVALWNIRGKIDITHSASQYLHKAVKNRCINFIKSKYNQAKSKEEPVASDIEMPYQEIGIEVEELHQTLRDAIASLPNRCRMAFNLSRHAGLSYQEIANQLGISKNTVENHMVTAIKK